MSVASTDREGNRWAVLALLSVVQLMVVLDATIVTIAIPSAQARPFGAGVADGDVRGIS
jgi:hypothetical protein